MLLHDMYEQAKYAAGNEEVSSLFIVAKKKVMFEFEGREKATAAQEKVVSSYLYISLSGRELILAVFHPG